VKCGPKRASVLVALVWAATLFAQGPDTLWTRTYGEGLAMQYGHSVQKISDGGYILRGSSWGMAYMELSRRHEGVLQS